MNAIKIYVNSDGTVRNNSKEEVTNFKLDSVNTIHFTSPINPLNHSVYAMLELESKIKLPAKLMTLESDEDIDGIMWYTWKWPMISPAITSLFQYQSNPIWVSFNIKSYSDEGKLLRTQTTERIKLSTNNSDQETTSSVTDYEIKYNDLLLGKTLLNFGDSIAAGSGNNGIGYADMIAANHHMILHDYAVGGSAIAPRTDRMQVIEQIHKSIVNGDQADYILFNGGTNDAINDQVVAGTITSGYQDDYDIKTFCGAFEYLCRTMKVNWLGAKIIYVRAHNMCTRDNRQKTYGDLAMKICKKWSIPVVDMYHEGGLNTQVFEMKADYVPDGTHPNEQGYLTYYVPSIYSKMKSI